MDNLKVSIQLIKKIFTERSKCFQQYLETVIPKHILEIYYMETDIFEIEDVEREFRCVCDLIKDPEPMYRLYYHEHHC